MQDGRTQRGLWHQQQSLEKVAVGAVVRVVLRIATLLGLRTGWLPQTGTVSVVGDMTLAECRLPSLEGGQEGVERLHGWLAGQKSDGAVGILRRRYFAVQQLWIPYNLDAKLTVQQKQCRYSCNRHSVALAEPAEFALAHPLFFVPITPPFDICSLLD